MFYINQPTVKSSVSPEDRQKIDIAYKDHMKQVQHKICADV